MAYIALYREWRPQLFRDIVGQEHVTRTLQNAIRQNRFAHAYLFNGPRGTGKTSAAKILAKAINCERGPSEEPCNECHACIGITKGTIMDVMEIDAASNRGVDEIRDLRDKVKFAPTEVRYKVYIIDEVHMLTTEAFNALLKTLEEPPHHIMFILATTEPHKLPATIISRCQRFDFRRIMGRQIVDRLKFIAGEKDVKVEEEAYWLVARAAEGGMRDALSIFDQVIAFGDDEVRASDIVSMVGSIGSETLSRIARGIADRNPQIVLGHLADLLDKGKDIGQLMHDMITYFRDLLMQKTVPHLEEVQDRANYDREFAEIADLFDTQLLIQMIEQMTQLQNELKWQSQGRLLMEMLMVRLCKTQSFDPTEMLRRIDELESKLSGGGGFPAASPFPSAPAAAATVPADVLNRIAELERRIASGVAAAPVPSYAPPEQRMMPQAPPAARGGDAQPATAPSQAAMPIEPARPAAPAPAPAVRMGAGGKNPLDTILAQPDMEGLGRAQQFWGRVLDKVKETSRTVQALLLGGNPVGVGNGYIVVAFKYEYHFEQVMKDKNKAVIDPIFTQLMGGTPHQLFAVTEKDWEAFKARGPIVAEAAVTEEESEQSQGNETDPLVEKAHALFDPEHVEVLD